MFKADSELVLGLGFPFDKILESQSGFYQVNTGLWRTESLRLYGLGELVDAKMRDKIRQRSRQVMCFVLEVQAEALLGVLRGPESSWGLKLLHFLLPMALRDSNSYPVFTERKMRSTERSDLPKTK